MTPRVCGPCCGAAGIEPISGCWSLSRTGTEMRNDIECDSPESTLWTLSVPKMRVLRPNERHFWLVPMGLRVCRLTSWRSNEVAVAHLTFLPVTGRCRLFVNCAVSRGASWPGQRTSRTLRVSGIHNQTTGSDHYADRRTRHGPRRAARAP
jgi:hypothetical protein